MNVNFLNDNVDWIFKVGLILNKVMIIHITNIVLKGEATF